MVPYVVRSSVPNVFGMCRDLFRVKLIRPLYLTHPSVISRCHPERSRRSSREMLLGTSFAWTSTALSLTAKASVILNISKPLQW